MQNGYFDATNIEPSQPSGNIHPPGKKLQAVISSTCLKPSKAGDALMLVISFTTPLGQLDSRYNLWNKNAQAVDIAERQLSAVCRAVGVFKVMSITADPTPADFDKAGIELRNTRLIIDVDYQSGQEPSEKLPHGGYTELKRVYDVNGNEPGKAPVAQQPQRVLEQGASWTPGPNAAQPAANGSGWGNQAQPAPNQPAPPQAVGWTPGPNVSGEAKPSWAK